MPAMIVDLLDISEIATTINAVSSIFKKIYIKNNSIIKQQSLR